MTVRRGYVKYVHLVHEAFDCLESGNWERLRQLIAPNAVMTPLEIWPEPGPFIGPDESIREYQRLFQLFPGIELSVGNIVSHEMWVIAHYRGVLERGRVDPPNQIEFTGVHRFEDELFAESHYRLARDGALAAAGL